MIERRERRRDRVAHDEVPKELFGVQAIVQPLVHQPQCLLKEVETAANRGVAAQGLKSGHHIGSNRARSRFDINGFTRLPERDIERLRRLLQGGVVPRVKQLPELIKPSEGFIPAADDEVADDRSLKWFGQLTFGGDDMDDAIGVPPELITRIIAHARTLRWLPSKGRS